MPIKDHEERLKANRKWAKEHKDKVKESMKKWRKTPKGREYTNEESSKYRRKYRKRLNIANRIYRENVRRAVFENYGSFCACCGEDDIRFLSIDHVNNDGNHHRKTDPRAKDIYYWLRKHNFPEGFQVLCFNCNIGKKRHGVCPHKIKPENIKGR